MALRNRIVEAMHDWRKAEMLVEMAKAKYEEIALLYCGEAEPEVCNANAEDYAKVLVAHEEWLAAHDAYIPAFCTWEAANHEAHWPRQEYPNKVYEPSETCRS